MINRLPILPPSLDSIEMAAPVSPAATASSIANHAFQQLLGQAVSHVEGTRTEADVQINKLLTGQGGELHQVALATQRAEAALELFQEMRNKVVNAYQEVMRMQL